MLLFVQMCITVNNLEHVLQHLRSLNTELAPQVNIFYYLSIENNSVTRFGDILGNGRISLCHSLVLRLHNFQESPDGTETNTNLAKIIEETLENTDALIYRILSTAANQVRIPNREESGLRIFVAGAWDQEARLSPGLVS